MSETDEKLKKETEKWLKRLEQELAGVNIAGDSGKKHFENMCAYISDSRHFLGKNDFIRAFECAIWAWSICELCIELNIFSKK